MFKTFISLFIFCLFFISNAQTTFKKDSLFNETQLLKHIQTLSSDVFEGRRTGTQGALKARKYIVNQFYSSGVLSFNKTYEQPFMFYQDRKEYKGVNIIGYVKGSLEPEKYIVISAHYDHEGIKNGKIYNGADDDASGTSALFTFAEFFKTNKPNHSVILVAFDGEELGLQGSKYFVNNSIIPIKNIKMNINLDMISRSDENELFAVGTSYNKSVKHIITDFEHSKQIKLTAGHDGFDGLENWTYSSDHGSFHKKDIPFLYFGVADHKDYHQPTDDFENIHPEFYKEAVKTIISVFQKIDNSKF